VPRLLLIDAARSPTGRQNSLKINHKPAMSRPGKDAWMDHHPSLGTKRRFRAKDGGGGGNWTRVPSQPTSRDYMLIPDNFFCYAMLSGLKSHCLVRMIRSRLTTRGLRRQPCLLLRPSTVAGVQRRTSWP